MNAQSAMSAASERRYGIWAKRRHRSCPLVSAGGGEGSAAAPVPPLRLDHGKVRQQVLHVPGGPEGQHVGVLQGEKEPLDLVKPGDRAHPRVSISPDAAGHQDVAHVLLAQRLGDGATHLRTVRHVVWVGHVVRKDHQSRHGTFEEHLKVIEIDGIAHHDLGPPSAERFESLRGPSEHSDVLSPLEQKVRHLAADVPRRTHHSDHLGLLTHPRIILFRHTRTRQRLPGLRRLTRHLAGTNDQQRYVIDWR